MVINTNIAATAASRTLGESAKALSASLTRLSSGSKIVSPEDDAAGLAQYIKFDSQISRNEAVNSNITNAISFSQTQDAFLEKVQVALDRMSELSILAQDLTKTDDDREAYDTEYQQMVNFINDIATKTFNGVELFQNKYEVIDTGGLSWSQSKDDAESRGGHLVAITSGREMANILGMLGADFSDNMWIGATDENIEGSWEWVTGENFDYSNWGPGGQPSNSYGTEHYAQYWGSRTDFVGTWNDVRAAEIKNKYIIEYDTESTLKVTIDDEGKTFDLERITPIITQGSIATVQDAEMATKRTKASIDSVAYSRADIGSNIMRLKNTADSVVSMNGNLSAAKSRIKDVDVAEESTRFARSSILVQSGSAMLSQANILPEMILKLVG